MGCLKPCANFVGITVISAPVSSKKSISFSFMLPFTKILWSLCWITGKGSYSQPQQLVFFWSCCALEEPELAVLQFQWSLAELLQGCVQAEKEQNYA